MVRTWAYIPSQAKTEAKGFGEANHGKVTRGSTVASVLFLLLERETPFTNGNFLYERKTYVLFLELFLHLLVLDGLSSE